MTGLRIFGAAALLAAMIATPTMAQPAMQEPGAYLQDHPWASGYYYSYGYRPSTFWPADVAAGVVAGTVGTAAAIASAPYRDSYAYYGDSSDDTYAYYGDRPISRRSTCGLQSGATYMGPDGRWYPC
jgi:hypothetical protein